MEEGRVRNWREERASMGGAGLGRSARPWKSGGVGRLGRAGVHGRRAGTGGTSCGRQLQLSARYCRPSAPISPSAELCGPRASATD